MLSMVSCLLGGLYQCSGSKMQSCEFYIESAVACFSGCRIHRSADEVQFNSLPSNCHRQHLIHWPKYKSMAWFTVSMVCEGIADPIKVKADVSEGWTFPVPNISMTPTMRQQTDHWNIKLAYNYISTSSLFLSNESLLSWLLSSCN